MVLDQGHRGPDSHGTVAFGSVALGHARLSIVDLSSAGDQPFVSDHAALTFNGEIYNCRSLGRDLERRGVVFRGTSDTEVLFQMLAMVGVDETLARIRGMYAFGFLDRRSGELVLARDPMGIKPLAWTRSDGDLWFASEVAGLRAAVPVRPDPVRTLFSLLGRAEATGWQSVFAGVNLVAPGEYLVVADGQVQKSVLHHDLTALVDADQYQDLEDRSLGSVAEELNRLLARSTEDRLLSDAPMGSFVSGGVDSAMVAALAAPADVDHTLLTADVVGRYSERSAAEELAAFVGRPLEIIEFRPEMLIDDWAASTLSHESPLIAHVNSVPFRRVARRARERGLKAVLTGEGADELFLGYPLMLLDAYERPLSVPIRTLRRLYGLVPGLADKLAPTRGGGQPAFLADLVEDHAASRTRARGLGAFSFLPPAQAERQLITFSYLTEHLQTLLHRNDRMGMSAGIEARFPYLDEAVVRFGLNLPYRHKVRFTSKSVGKRPPLLQQKAVLRDLASSTLPTSLARRAKLGFPMHGHLDVITQPELFRDGYVAEIAGLSQFGMRRVVETGSRYLVAKLVSIEVFGQLFAYDQSVEQVTERLRRSVRIRPDHR